MSKLAQSLKITIKAKDFAAEMTNVNVQSKDLQGEPAITQEHVDNNQAVRKMLLERGIVPENLPPAEDVKKVQRRLKSEEKKALANKKKEIMVPYNPILHHRRSIRLKGYDYSSQGEIKKNKKDK